MPVWKQGARSGRHAWGKLAAAHAASRATTRELRPGTAFPSHSTKGTRSPLAAMAIGSETSPPVVKTASGRQRRSIAVACGTDNPRRTGSRAAATDRSTVRSDRRARRENGTPDPGPDNGTTDCNTKSEEVVTLTGARSGCVSARGAFDMVGNLQELVADWVAAPTFCPGWASFSNDQMCLAGAATDRNFPGALIRGGWFASGPAAGPFAVTAFPPFRATSFVGVRCVR